MVNKKLGIIASFWVVVSLVFLIPLNMGSVFAAGESITNEQAQSTVCGDTNIKGSIILSIVTMCLPGILEKAYEYKQIKCEAAQCYYSAVKSGLDPSFCVKHEAYKTCTFIVGEAFAIPPMSILEYYRNAISQILANPVGALWSGGAVAARKAVSATCTTPNACTFGTNPPYAAMTVFLVVTDSLALFQQIKDMIDNGFFPPLDPANACDGLEDVRSEMELILKAK